MSCCLIFTSLIRILPVQVVARPSWKYSRVCMPFH